MSKLLVMRKAIVPLVAALAVLIQVAAVGQTQRPSATRTAATFETTVQPFLKKNCYGCHNESLMEGTLNLTKYKTWASVEEERSRWELIVKRVKGGEMPPETEERPKAADILAVTSTIENEFARLDRTAKPDPGRVTARRLNRAEYNHTVQDLLGVNFRPADDFPQDDTGYGFDTIGDVLSISSNQMEKYLTAAETVARTAVYGSQSSKPTIARYQPAGRRRPGDPDNLFFNTHPWLSVTNYDESGLSMPNSFHVFHFFPVTGEYVFRPTPDNGSRPQGSEGLEMAAFVDGKQIGLTVIEGQLEGKTQEFHATVTAGEHWITIGFPRQFEGLPVAYGGKNPSKRPPPPAGGRRGGGGGLGGAGRGAAVPGAAGTPQQISGAPPGAGPRGGAAGAGAARGGRGGAGADPNAANNNDDAASNAFYSPPGAPAGTRLARPDNMGIQSVEIGGPSKPVVRPSAESLKNVFICDLKAVGCDRRIISNLVRRAYRRPATKLEIDEVMAQMARVKKRGDPAEEQLVVGIQAILVSPNFLFRVEKDRFVKVATAAAPDARYLNDYELASRLSYFLWSSLPDEALLRVAAQGTLRQPQVLTAQVKRMLADPKISRFVENFGGQWLQFRGLESQQPDFYLYPSFDNYLRHSMKKETELFFENIIREDRNILEFLDADYTFVNEYLGQYYGLREVKGPEFRKVSLTSTPRRGILGQASMLTVSSYGNRTSVVLRGKWVLENLLNAPPPPPPANVPDLDQAKTEAGATLRQRMAAHRDNATCASCHAKMDPIGLGLENYDAIGKWRDKDGKLPIDASGTLPDGRTFNGPTDLAKLLRSESDAFSEAVAEKIMTYALGRGVEPFDRPALRKITAGVKAGQYKFSSLILEVVKSLPFQMRKGERSKV